MKEKLISDDEASEIPNLINEIEAESEDYVIKIWELLYKLEYEVRLLIGKI